MPRLESAIKEALRLHPPLILVARVASVDVEVGGYRIPAGKLVAASPRHLQPAPEAFGDPEVFRPGRYLEDPGADLANPWNWIPFGAGRHRCVGAAFAMMQLKAIFSVLLKDWTFEAAQPLDSYHNDHSKMVVQLAQPCLANFHRRDSSSSEVPADQHHEFGVHADDAPSTRTEGWRIVVDRDLCQGHAVCENEAPSLFAVSKKGELTILDQRPRNDARERAEAAVRYCPTHALSIVDDE
jgi:sterol 14-demethylase